MPTLFPLQYPTPDGDHVHTLHVGEILFLLGANGTGKSSLVSRFFSAHSGNAKRISAHRQTWFSSNTLDLTPRTRENLDRSIRNQDTQVTSRWKQEYAAERTGLAIYDMIDADNMLARSIADLVRLGELSAAAEKAQTPSPFEVVNELLRQANIPIHISVEARERVLARRGAGEPYSVAELSDGERNAFLIAADVLTAPAGSLLLIDEPERHLHRSIISPLLTGLFEKRPDCAFIVSTHELMLPIDNPAAQTLLVRACDYQDGSIAHWRADLLASNAAIDDELKKDILGARTKMIFVEGKPQSLDAPLYSLLFPLVSIVAKDSCRDVEHAVKGLRELKDVHWVQAWGIVDNDGRKEDDIQRLRDIGVYALPHYSVEALYYHPTIVRQVALRQARVTGADAEAMIAAAITAAMEAATRQRDHFIRRAVERLVRQEIARRYPAKELIASSDSIDIRLDVAEVRREEERIFDRANERKDFEALLRRYPLRESSALDQIATTIGLSRANYQAAVRKCVEEDQSVRDFLRKLFRGLFEETQRDETPGAPAAV